MRLVCRGYLTRHVLGGLPTAARRCDVGEGGIRQPPHDGRVVTRRLLLQVDDALEDVLTMKIDSRNHTRGDDDKNASNSIRLTGGFK
jgi:hypothetical protein